MTVLENKGFKAFLVSGIITLAGSGVLSVPVKAQNGESTATVTVLPEVTTRVVLSNQDVNRIVCLDGEIEGYQYSQEKGADVQHAGSDAFIKFQVVEIGTKTDYIRGRNEFYFMCAGRTYTLLADPRKVPAKKIFLKAVGSDVAKVNKTKFDPLAEEERVVRITLEVLRGKIPDTYTINMSNKPYNSTVLPKMDVRLAREIKIEGTPYRATEYHLRARTSITLEERQFLQAYFGTGIHSVTLDRLKLSGGEVGRVILIHRGEG